MIHCVKLTILKSRVIHYSYVVLAFSLYQLDNYCIVYDFKIFFSFYFAKMELSVRQKSWGKTVLGVSVNKYLTKNAT